MNEQGQEDRPIKVIFRVFQERNYGRGQVIALFPEEPADYHGALCVSYMHIGQHGDAAPYPVILQTKLAEPIEYADLLEELRQIGYQNLIIRQKESQKMRDVRERRAKEWREAAIGGTR